MGEPALVLSERKLGEGVLPISLQAWTTHLASTTCPTMGGSWPTWYAGWLRGGFPCR